jgi:hypothetical protein
MSSDSEESHSSAHRNIQDQVAHSHQDQELPVDQDQDLATEESATSDHGRDDAQEEEGEELESIDSGGNGLTFARVRSRGTQQAEDETTSEPSFRPKVERPGSPESTSTPDDTPSIQVGHIDITLQTVTNKARAQDCLRQGAVFLCHTALFVHIGRPHYSLLNAVFLRDFHPLRLHRPAHRPRPSCPRTRDSLPCPATCSSNNSQTRPKHHKRPGR